MTDKSCRDGQADYSLIAASELYPALARGVKKKLDIRKMNNVIPSYKESLTNDDRLLLNMISGWNNDYIDELLKYEIYNMHFQAEEDKRK